MYNVQKVHYKNIIKLFILWIIEREFNIKFDKYFFISCVFYNIYVYINVKLYSILTPHCVLLKLKFTMSKATYIFYIFFFK